MFFFQLVFEFQHRCYEKLQVMRKTEMPGLYSGEYTFSDQCSLVIYFADQHNLYLLTVNLKGSGYSLLVRTKTRLLLQCYYALKEVYENATDFHNIQFFVIQRSLYVSELLMFISGVLANKWLHLVGPDKKIFDKVLLCPKIMI